MEKVRRVTAFITVLVIGGLIIGTLICAITGSQYFFGMLALMFLIPLILWVFMWFTKLTSDKSQKVVEDTKDTEEGR